MRRLVPLVLLFLFLIGCGLLPTETKVRYIDKPCPTCPDTCDDKGRDKD